MTQETWIVLYTDGGVRPVNPGPGGYCALAVYDNGYCAVAKGGEPETTNNRMELYAVISGLEMIQEDAGPSNIRVISDSEYVVKGYTKWLPRWLKKGWKTASGKPVMNQDLWHRFATAVAKHHRVTFGWTRGHSGHVYNEAVDKIATEEALKQAL